jgi:hypothetical protein
MKVLFLTILSVFLGCSEPFTSVKPTAEMTNPSTDSSVAVPMIPQSSEHAEIVWKSADENVDGFIIKFGPSKETLVSEVRLLVSDVETLSGNYRYLLKDIPAGKPLYVSIASFKGSEISPFSAPEEIR